MKILFWAPVFLPDVGGIELVSMHLIQSLRQRGHELMVVTTHGRVAAPDFSVEDGFPVYRFPILSALQDQNLPQLISIQREIQTIKRTFLPEVEHLHFGGPTPIAYLYLRAAATAPAPMILSLHAPLRGLEGGSGSITGQILCNAAWTTAVSRAVLEEARHLVPEIREHSSVVYNGIQDTAIEPAQLPFKDVCILCLGRLIQEKGYNVAINAFAEIVQIYPNARMMIAGDGPIRQDLEQQVESYQLMHAVEFSGAYELKDVYDLINQATVVVVPSRYREAFGQVALEASQMARPVVASHVGGLAEAVLDGETGILVESGNQHAIAEAVIWLLENPEAAVKMGQNGYHRAHTHFSWDRCVNNFENLYMQFKKENL